MRTHVTITWHEPGYVMRGMGTGRHIKRMVPSTIAAQQQI